MVRDNYNGPGTGIVIVAVALGCMDVRASQLDQHRTGYRLITGVDCNRLMKMLQISRKNTVGPFP